MSEMTSRAQSPEVSTGRETASSDDGFVKALTLTDATMLVAGSMIGSGIFIVSADIGRTVGSPFWMLMAWIVTGVITLLGALSYGELAGMYPRAGGQYAEHCDAAYLLQNIRPVFAAPRLGLLPDGNCRHA